MSIHTETRACLDGKVGLIRLDAPRSLNALSEHMINGMQAILDEWAADPDVCLVLLWGSGDRGFCAGGDIRELHQAMTGGEGDLKAIRYFSAEYRLDYTLHTYPKPVVCWAHGATMGGGLGLLAASRYRVVTPSIKLAMPEISIGLFPDVGAGYFLNRLPEGIGLFLGLTGARLNQTDSMRIGLADLAVADEKPNALLDRIVDTRWSGEVAADDNRLYRLLSQFAQDQDVQWPESQLAAHEQRIPPLCRGESLPSVVEQLINEPHDDPWWQTAIGNLRNGCPTTAWLVWAQMRKARQLSLKEIFRMELVMAVRCCAGQDLKEGIRARLIDKDNEPKWQFAGVEDVPEAHVDMHFIPPWMPADDPLAEL
ncbi:enoyl-CoA hydratase/isomerase family protein [Marinobacter fonticola]|uniref:enoyl-CoA hydratase/isomerase family protein n=1 Tax=Marinobacter fonticola TaxID=2603215 RepID=UPI0011E72B18|nr:enoyl-CoA hydratase/isomerase family protein [Marinobacter fonticola]